MLTYIKPNWDKDEAFFVETYWLSQDRVWLSQLKDSNLNQVGEAEMSANKPTAKLAHKRLIEQVTAGYIPFIEEHFIR